WIDPGHFENAHLHAQSPAGRIASFPSDFSAPSQVGLTWREEPPVVDVATEIERDITGLPIAIIDLITAYLRADQCFPTGRAVQKMKSAALLADWYPIDLLGKLTAKIFQRTACKLDDPPHIKLGSAEF